MAFDPNSGRPVGGFDIASAKPAETTDPTLNDYAMQLTQGMTFGASDEIEAAARAAVGGLSNLVGEDDGTTFSERYSDTHADLNERMRQTADESPWLSGGLQVAGAIPTGVAGAGKLAGTKAAQLASNIPKWLQMSLAGGAGGATYGFNTGEGIEDRLGKAATEGAIAAAATPVGAKALKVGGNAVMRVANRIKQKLSETPGSRANAVIREMIELEGLTPEEARAVYRELGDEGTLMDVGENPRMVGRALYDTPGEGKRTVKELVETRQQGQQDRLMESVQRGTGMDADTASDFSTKIRAEREAQAAPLYQAAYTKGIEPSPGLLSVLERPAVASAMRNAEKLARNMGQPPDSGFGTLNRIHWAKMNLDDQISSEIRRAGMTNKAVSLIDAKNALLREVDELSPEYAQARQIWSDASTLDNSIDSGRDMFKMKTGDLRRLTEGMTDSERIGFKAGAVEAIQEKMDTIGLTHDAQKRFLNTKDMRNKMRHVFDSDAEYDEFIKDAANEGAFMRTRNVTTGGSPTSQNLAGQGMLETAAEGQAFYNTDMVGKAMLVAKKLLGEEELDPAFVRELTDKIANRNLTDEQLAKILSQGNVGQMLAKRIGTPSPAATTAAIVPLLSQNGGN